MKRTIIILTTALLLSVTHLEASRLFLRTNSINAKANISGDLFYSQDGYFEITQLQAGNHFIRVSSKIRGTRGRQHSTINIYSGSIFIPQNSQVFARVTPRGRLIIDEVVSRRRNTTPQRCEAPVRSGRGTDYGQSRTERGSQNRTVNYFDIALDQIRNASFDSDKRSIARQFITSNDVTSQEVLLIIESLDYESSRLQIAKFAYDRTIDPENYFIVNQGFEYTSSRRSLERFIR